MARRELTRKGLINLLNIGCMKSKIRLHNLYGEGDCEYGFVYFNETNVLEDNFHSFNVEFYATDAKSFNRAVSLLEFISKDFEVKFRGERSMFVARKEQDDRTYEKMWHARWYFDPNNAE